MKTKFCCTCAQPYQAQFLIYLLNSSSPMQDPKRMTDDDLLGQGDFFDNLLSLLLIMVTGQHVRRSNATTVTVPRTRGQSVAAGEFPHPIQQHSPTSNVLQPHSHILVISACTSTIMSVCISVCNCLMSYLQLCCYNITSISTL